MKDIFGRMNTEEELPLNAAEIEPTRENIEKLCSEIEEKRKEIRDMADRLKLFETLEILAPSELELQIAVKFILQYRQCRKSGVL